MININLELVPIDITKHIEKFRLFLGSCWPYLDDLMKDHDWDEDIEFIDNWLEVNWKFLVERELLGEKGYILPLSVPYEKNLNVGKRASFFVAARTKNGASGVGMKKILPNNKIFRLFGFCTRCQIGGFGLYPPFDLANLVLDSTKELFIVPFNELEFYLERCEGYLKNFK